MLSQQFRYVSWYISGMFSHIQYVLLGCIGTDHGMLSQVCVDGPWYVIICMCVWTMVCYHMYVCMDHGMLSQVCVYWNGQWYVITSINVLVWTMVCHHKYVCIGMDHGMY